MTYENQTPQQLAEELRGRDTMERTLRETDTRYAIKLTERIVFALVTIIMVAFMAGLIRLVFIK